MSPALERGQTACLRASLARESASVEDNVERTCIVELRQSHSDLPRLPRRVPVQDECHCNIFSVQASVRWMMRDGSSVPMPFEGGRLDPGQFRIDWSNPDWEP